MTWNFSRRSASGGELGGRFMTQRTTALRPSLLPDETLLFVQDAVGLYEGYIYIYTRLCPVVCMGCKLTKR